MTLEGSEPLAQALLLALIHWSAWKINSPKFAARNGHLADAQKLTTTFAVFQFRLEPVMDVMDAVAAEAEAIAWREENASSP